MVMNEAVLRRSPMVPYSLLCIIITESIRDAAFGEVAEVTVIALLTEFPMGVLHLDKLLRPGAAAWPCYFPKDALHWLEI